MPKRSGLVVTAADINAIVSALELTQVPSYVGLNATSAFVSLEAVTTLPLVTMSVDSIDLQAQAGYVALAVLDFKLDPSLTYRAFSDSFAFGETFGISVDFGRAFDETFFPEDVVSLHAQLVLNSAFLLDDMESVDDLAIQTGIRKTNLVLTLDALALNIAKPLTDDVSFSELLLITFNVSLLDIIAVADTFLLELAFVPTAVANGAPLNTFALNE